MMKIVRSLLVVFFLGAIGCDLPRPDAGFSIDEQPKTILGNEGLEEFFYWDIVEHDNLWELDIGEHPGIKAFRDTMNLLLGRHRLENVIKKESSQSLNKEMLLKQEDGDGDRTNALLVHTGSIGHIRPINALEAQILNYQLVKYPLIRHPTEFHGFIAYNHEQGSYRVYFGASDQPWPPRPDLLIQQLNEDIKNGWRLKYHLHNHYESETNDYLGILAPSLADAHYFKWLSEEYGLEKALITNGYHTVEIESDGLYKFESH